MTVDEIRDILNSCTRHEMPDDRVVWKMHGCYIAHGYFSSNGRGSISFFNSDQHIFVHGQDAVSLAKCGTDVVCERNYNYQNGQQLFDTMLQMTRN